MRKTVRYSLLPLLLGATLLMKGETAWAQQPDTTTAYLKEVIARKRMRATLPPSERVGSVRYVRDLKEVFNVDYVMITSEVLYLSRSLNFLAHLRALHDGLDVVIVSTDDIYGQFPEVGLFSEYQSIERFLKDQVYLRWGSRHTQDGRPAYLLLVGDVDEIPIYLDRTLATQYYDEVATDHYYGFLEGKDEVPDLMVGRISVQREEELRRVVDKIYRHQYQGMDGAWRRRALFVWGSFKPGGAYFYTTNLLSSALGLHISGLFRNKGAVVQDVIEAIQEGQGIVSYSGHGSEIQWELIDRTHLRSLTNGDRPALVLSFACQAGRFDWPTDGLGEAFVKQAGGGAVAFYGASRLSSSLDFITLEKYLFEAMAVQGAETLGEAILVAEMKTLPGIRQGAVYNLLGDPALRLWPDPDRLWPSAELNIPPLEVSIQNRDRPIYETDRIRINVAVSNVGTADGENVTVVLYAVNEEEEQIPLMKERTILQIEAGREEEITVFWRPSGARGRHRIVAEVYPGVGQREGFSFNNRAEQEVMVLPYLPNLRVLEEEIRLNPAHMEEGGQVEVSATVHNVGPLPAPGVRVRFFDGDPARGGRIIGPDIDLGDIEAGGEAVASIRWANVLGPYNHRVYVDVDPEDRVDEWKLKDDNLAHQDLYVFMRGEEMALMPRSGSKSVLSISGDYGVWQESESIVDIYGLNLETGEAFAFGDGAGFQKNPTMSGDMVVWQDGSTGNWDIRRYDLLRDQEAPVASLPYSEKEPSISGNRIVWQRSTQSGDWDIYGVDLGSGHRFAVSTVPGTQESPKISGDYVVWQDMRNGDWDIYGYDIGREEEFPICTEPGDQVAPHLYWDTVVWQDAREGRWDIHGYHMGTGKHFFIPTAGHSRRPKVSGSVVVWEEDGRILGYDLRRKSTFLVFSDEEEQAGPYISANRVVWLTRSRGGDALRGRTVAFSAFGLPYLKITPVKDDLALQWEIIGPEKEHRFDVYRKVGSGEYAKINEEPISEVRRFAYTDSNFTRDTKYFYRVERIEDGSVFGPVSIATGDVVPLLGPEEVPTLYELQPNFPNPFNPFTSLPFILGGTGRVSLKIYNTQGQVVRTLVDQILEMGKHTFRWDGRDELGREMGSGLYFYQLRIGRHTETGKMTLLK